MAIQSLRTWWSSWWLELCWYYWTMLRAGQCTYTYIYICVHAVHIFTIEIYKYNSDYTNLWDIYKKNIHTYIIICIYSTYLHKRMEHMVSQFNFSGGLWCRGCACQRGGGILGEILLTGKGKGMEHGKIIGRPVGTWENLGKLIGKWRFCLCNYGKSTCWMGKLTVSMAIFNRKLLVSTRGYISLISYITDDAHCSEVPYIFFHSWSLWMAS